MTNAKREFLDHITDRCVSGRTLKCANIHMLLQGSSYLFSLPCGYSAEELDAFLSEIDVDYNNTNYCSTNYWQYLRGTIWYNEDSTWSTHECDLDCEYWELHVLPDIPCNLIKEQKDTE